MAASWPSKANYATGDVLTAANMNQVGDNLNDLNTRVSAAGGFWKNPVLNSNFSVWQRGTSIACSTTAYTADRWQGYRAVAGSTVSRQTTSDTTNLPNIQYCARVQRDSGNTSTTQIYLGQSFETINSIPFVGKTITFSFYARAGANYSSASNALNYRVVYGTGTDQNVITSYTGANNFIDQVATLTTTWQRFSYSATVSTSATELGVYFYNTPVGTAGAADYYEITGVQLEVGSSASAYYPNGNTYQAELAACQRYYWRNASGSTNYSFFAWGIGQGSSQALWAIPCPVTMRTTPTTVDFANLGLAQTGAITAITTLTHSNSSPSSVFLQSDGANTANTIYRLMANNSASAYVGVGAEL